MSCSGASPTASAGPSPSGAVADRARPDLDSAAAGDLPVVAVVGPTASGKSDLALALAERLAGEVVNADAMQLYRGMDIGTAKLEAAERRGVPHHQLDVLDVREEASVAAYQREARADAAAIRERGRVPVYAGGSGLYLRAALDRLEIPPTDPAVRARLEAELEAMGVAVMYKRLKGSDPVAARSIQPNNGRRVVRALEVIEPTVMIGLHGPRPELDARIAARVHRMWQRGLLEEVRALDTAGLREGRTASKALGYSQALAHLDGRLSAADAIEDTVTATRKFARRQESWFRPDERVVWLPWDAPDLLARALDVVSAALVDNGRR